MLLKFAGSMGSQWLKERNWFGELGIQGKQGVEDCGNMFCILSCFFPTFENAFSLPIAATLELLYAQILSDDPGVRRCSFFNGSKIAQYLMFLVSGDLRGSVSHESAISRAKMLAKEAIKYPWTPPWKRTNGIFMGYSWFTFPGGRWLLRLSGAKSPRPRPPSPVLRFGQRRRTRTRWCVEITAPPRRPARRRRASGCLAAPVPQLEKSSID